MIGIKFEKGEHCTKATVCHVYPKRKPKIILMREARMSIDDIVTGIREVIDLPSTWVLIDSEYKQVDTNESTNVEAAEHLLKAVA